MTTAGPRARKRHARLGILGAVLAFGFTAGAAVVLLTDSGVTSPTTPVSTAAAAPHVHTDAALAGAAGEDQGFFALVERSSPRDRHARAGSGHAGRARPAALADPSGRRGVSDPRGCCCCGIPPGGHLRARDRNPLHRWYQRCPVARRFTHRRRAAAPGHVALRRHWPRRQALGPHVQREHHDRTGRFRGHQRRVARPRGPLHHPVGRGHQDRARATRRTWW